MSCFLRLYLDAVVFMFGAVVGSFLNVCIHRMPREESVVRPPSHCPSCNQPIHWWDNIPLVSYVVLRGKCRHCQVRISPRYVSVELLTALLFLASWLKFRDSSVPMAAIYWTILAGFIAATFIDFEHYIIPNEITVGGAVTGLVVSALYPALHGASTILGGLGWSVLGVFVGGGTLLTVAILGEKIFKKEAMGMGDVKLLAAIGAFLGWQAALFSVFASSLVGGVVGLTLVATGGKEWSSRIPYGPHIVLGAVVWMFWGPDLMNWYFNFLTS
jgi:leader peptidase (prepilin peptidase)/N-methyltransferase